MNLKASGTLKAGARIQYLCTMVLGEALRQLYAFSDEVESASPENLTSIVLVLGVYIFPVNALSKRKRSMRCRMRNPLGLKVRRYADPFFGLNEFLAVFPVAKISDKTCVTEMNKILVKRYYQQLDQSGVCKRVLLWIHYF